MKKRRWFALRIRDLFFLTAIAAILISWRMDRQKLILHYDPPITPRANWQVDQVTGAPNTAGQGDIPTAWASASRDNQKEWLELSYKWLTKPAAIEIHESYNPGAVYKVTMFDWRGVESVVWEGSADITTRQKIGVQTIAIKNSFFTRRVKIYIDSPAVLGWNEIDAVGMVSKNGKKQWAVSAKASSCYDTSINQGLGGLVQFQSVGRSAPFGN